MIRGRVVHDENVEQRIALTCKTHQAVPQPFPAVVSYDDCKNAGEALVGIGS